MDTPSKRIKSRLDDLGLSFQQAGDLIGVSWQAVQQWSNGKTRPRSTKEADIARVLQCSPEWLFYGVEIPPKNAGVLPSSNSNELRDSAQCSPYAPAWPFKSVAYARYSKLEAKDQRFVESVLLDAIVRCETQAPQKRLANRSC